MGLIKEMDNYDLLSLTHNSGHHLSLYNLLLSSIGFEVIETIF